MVVGGAGMEGGGCELVSKNEELGRCHLLLSSKRSFHRAFKSELLLGLEWCGVGKYDNLRMVYCLFYMARQDWHVVSGTVTGI